MSDIFISFVNSLMKNMRTKKVMAVNKFRSHRDPVSQGSGPDSVRLRSDPRLRFLYYQSPKCSFDRCYTYVGLLYSDQNDIEI